MRRSAPAGFTLVEILVVISVLGLLMSLLVPAMGKARATANDVKCRSNLRQWGVALSLYMNNNGGFIPRRGQGDRVLAKVDRGDDWFNCLPPYFNELPYNELVKQGRRPRAGDDSIFICPSADDTGGKYFLPYAMNQFLSPWHITDPHQIMSLPEPAKVVFLGDGPGPYASIMPIAKPYCVEPRHDGRANLLFLDGHVESFTGEYLGCGVGDPMRDDVVWQVGDGYDE